jgi:hypothetical protein
MHRPASPPPTRPGRYGGAAPATPGRTPLPQLGDLELDSTGLGRQQPGTGAVAVGRPAGAALVAAGPDHLGGLGVDQRLQHQRRALRGQHPGPPPTRSAASRSVMADSSRAIVANSLVCTLAGTHRASRDGPRLVTQQDKDLPSKSTTTLGRLLLPTDSLLLSRWRQPDGHGLVNAPACADRPTAAAARRTPVLRDHRVSRLRRCRWCVVLILPSTLLPRGVMAKSMLLHRGVNRFLRRCLSSEPEPAARPEPCIGCHKLGNGSQELQWLADHAQDRVPLSGQVRTSACRVPWGLSLQALISSGR